MQQVAEATSLGSSDATAADVDALEVEGDKLAKEDEAVYQTVYEAEVQEKLHLGA